VFKWCHQGQCAVEEKVTCRVEVLNLNSGIGEISIWVSNFYPASQPASQPFAAVLSTSAPQNDEAW
jgi:hypothetical protein